MSQTTLEVKGENYLNNDNSYFDFILGEPIKVKQGSTIDYVDSIIDLGNTSSSSLDVKQDMILGINFYIYEYDTPKVPDTQGTPAYYSKRNIYIPEDDTQIEGLAYPANAYIPNTQYGQKVNTYYPSCLPAFLCQGSDRRDIQNDPPYNQGNPPIAQDTFTASEFTAQVVIKAGNYSKTKFAQLVNDGFNLIIGSLTNQDKPAENIGNGQLNPNTPPAYKHSVSPVDFAQTPNNNSEVLRSFLRPWSDISHTQTKDPLAWDDGTYNVPWYDTDANFPFWFCPIYTKTYPDYEIDEPYAPYTWYTDGGSGFMAGTTKFNLEYDNDSDLFYIDYLHSPILDKDQREVVIMTDVLTKYADGSIVVNTGYKALGSLSGILISRLFSYVYDDDGNVIEENTGFWQEQIGFGFDDNFRNEMNTTMINKKTDIYYNTLTKVGSGGLDRIATRIIYRFNVNYPDPKYFDIATTKPLVPIQWLQQTNYTKNADDYGMAIITTTFPRTFQSVGTVPILGSNSAFKQPLPYYLIEVNINDVKNDNWRDKNSNYQIMNVCGRTYTTGDYIQSFNDGAVQALVLYEDININKISIKILNPDKSFAQKLGTNTTIFLKITQPIVLEKK